MTREERIQHSKRICQKITGRVGEISPKGLGHWPQTWRRVEAPSDAFLDALDRWVGEDTPATRLAVQMAGDALFIAWSDVGDIYRMEGTVATPEEANHAQV